MVPPGSQHLVKSVCALLQVSAGGSARVGTAALGCPAERSSAVGGCSAEKPLQIVGVVWCNGDDTPTAGRFSPRRADQPTRIPAGQLLLRLFCILRLEPFFFCCLGQLAA